MIDPIGKTFYRLGMQLPGCSLIPREDQVLPQQIERP
jgi:hypothetical protein